MMFQCNHDWQNTESTNLVNYVLASSLKTLVKQKSSTDNIKYSLYTLALHNFTLD